jgi:glycosyltransferase involved in cell wall biosynthesis
VLDAGIGWHAIQLSRSSTNPWTEVSTLRSIAQTYRTVAPDLVHHVTSKPVLYGTPVARWQGVRAVVNAISGIGHVFADDTPGHRLRKAAVSTGYRLALRHPHMRVIFQNLEHRDAFVARGWVRREECVLIPGSGVDTTEFVPASFVARPVPKVVLASRLLYTKGVGEFVEAAEILRRRGVRAELILVGEPDPDNPASVPRQQLERWAADGVVEWWGRRQDMAEVFAAVDIACLPSYTEGMPKVLLEAAASGLPLIATDIPGCRAIARHGDNGLLVPVRDATRLAEAIERLVLDASTRERMGRRSREVAVAEFSLDQVVRQTMDVYQSLLS